MMVNPIDFGGHSSNLKVTMGIIDKFGVCGECYALRCYIFENYYAHDQTLLKFKSKIEVPRDVRNSKGP